MVIANWKGKGSLDLVEKYNSISWPDNLIVAPGAVFLPLLKNTNLSFQMPMFLGETCGLNPISAYKEVGADYVIINHIEQKKYYSNGFMDYLNASIKAGLKVLLCFESILELDGLNDFENITLIYEEKGQINAEKMASDSLDRFVCLKNELKMPVFYGGSVNNENVKDVAKCADGVILGRASLDIEKLKEILNWF